MSVVLRWDEAPTGIRSQSGFTLFELIIVVILVGLLFVTAWWRLMPLRGDAEAAHVATTIGTLQSALGLAITERIVEDALDEIADLQNANPMTLLAQVPGNYIGEVNSAADADIPAGSWYFERNSRQLRYRVRFPRYLAADTEALPVDLAWQLRLAYRDSDGSGDFSPGVDVLQSVQLVDLDNPGWDEAGANTPEGLVEP